MLLRNNLSKFYLKLYLEHNKQITEEYVYQNNRYIKIIDSLFLFFLLSF